MVLVVEVRVNGETVGALVANPKVFKTGSTGFFGTGKVTIGGKRYQAQCQFIEIGSKEKEKSSEEPEEGEA